MSVPIRGPFGEEKFRVTAERYLFPDGTHTGEIVAMYPLTPLQVFDTLEFEGWRPIRVERLDLHVRPSPTASHLYDRRYGSSKACVRPGRACSAGPT